MTTASEPDASPSVLADEAVRLVEAARAWAQRGLDQAPIATGSQECQWCPVCRLIAALRADRTDLRTALDEITGALVAALSAHATSGAAHSSASAPGPAESAASSPSSARTYEPIDLSHRPDEQRS